MIRWVFKLMYNLKLVGELNCIYVEEFGYVLYSKVRMFCGFIR